MNKLLIVLLVAGLGWSLYRLGDVERQSYDMSTGVCEQEPVGMLDFKCLDTVEPVTNRLWDVAYGLRP